MTIPFKINARLDEPSKAEADGNPAQMGLEPAFDRRTRGEDADGNEATGNDHIADEAVGMR
jgi:hypothetical protein